jgi:diguanylate cyclase (GGDEF)-like protein
MPPWIGDLAMLHASALSVLLSELRRFGERFSPGLGIAAGYALGALASRAFGDGAAGQPLLALAAPMALGLLLRAGAPFRAADAARIAAVHVALAALFGQPAQDAAADLAVALVMIGVGALIFARLRAAGLIVSQLRLAAALGLAAVGGALAAAPVEALLAAHGPMTLAVHGLSGAIGSMLVLMSVMTFGRGAALRETGDCALDDPRPPLQEHLAAAALVAVLVLSSFGGGRPVAALGASVALLWYAIRLGLFATSLAALGFAAASLALSGMAGTAAPSADPLTAELLRYLALGLLAAPSLVVAAALHDQARLRRVFAYRALHDGLTTLANRSRFLEALEDASARADASGRRFALLLIDLDHFKSVNDGYGHARGDALLVEVSSKLRQSIRASDLVSRIGGDEFAVVAPVRTVEDAMCLARRLVETVNQPCDLGGVTVTPSITVGGVLAPDSAADPQRLMLLADEALYRAKAAGRNCWRFSDAGESPPLLRLWRTGDLEPAAETVFLD